MNNNRLSNDACIHLDAEMTVNGNDKCNYSTLTESWAFFEKEI